MKLGKEVFISAFRLSSRLRTQRQECKDRNWDRTTLFTGLLSMTFSTFLKPKISNPCRAPNTMCWTLTYQSLVNKTSHRNAERSVWTRQASILALPSVTHTIGLLGLGQLCYCSLWPSNGLVLKTVPCGKLLLHMVKFGFQIEMQS